VMNGFNGTDDADEEGYFGVLHRGHVYRKREVPNDYLRVPPE
jgi:hypothetical protein